MAGIGTIINAIGVLIGGILGLGFGRLLKQRFQDILMSACGLCVIFIGASGALEKILVVTDGRLSASGSMMIIASLCIGALAGEWLNIEYHTQRFGQWLKIKSKSDRDPRFVEGFVSTSLTICIGAMAVLGPIQDALYGDYSLLVTKAVLDAIIVLSLTASFGKGCIFSVIPIVAFEGVLTLFAKLIEPLMTPQALDNLSLVGSILIFCVGVNLVFRNKIKVANMLPALIVAVAYAFLPF